MRAGDRRLTGIGAAWSDQDRLRRVSTDAQNRAAQRDALTALGVSADGI